MLQAQIEIVDETGHTEDSVTIVGSGRVSIGRRGTGALLHADEAEADYAVIEKSDEQVCIQVKIRDGWHEDVILFNDLKAYERFIHGLERSLRIKRVLADGDLLQGSAIIRTIIASGNPVTSSLVRRAQASAERGAAAVSQQLQRLRDQGKIDDHGKLLVPAPDDMKPGSTTDL